MPKVEYVNIICLPLQDLAQVLISTGITCGHDLHCPEVYYQLCEYFHGQRSLTSKTRIPPTDFLKSFCSPLDSHAHGIADHSSQAFARDGIFSAFNRSNEPQQSAAEAFNRSESTGNEEQPYTFEKAASLAEEFREDINSLRCMLARWGVRLPESRFRENNAELMRFSFTTGLATAGSPAERWITQQLFWTECLSKIESYIALMDMSSLNEQKLCCLANA